mmetsp:Transcript_2654/g.6951  ORF Transcript_2654/g.6951 Transcript_2654/m.6951 type:complete len:87 (+) Transcript_2654:569-829(+)
MRGVNPESPPRRPPAEIKHEIGIESALGICLWDLIVRGRHTMRLTWDLRCGAVKRPSCDELRPSLPLFTTQSRHAHPHRTISTASF